MPLQAQEDLSKAMEEIMAFQKQLHEDYKNPQESPLDPVAMDSFKGHVFFPITLKYRVKAKLVRTPDAEVFQMSTTTDRKPEYQEYATLHFELEGKKQVLHVYQSLKLRQQDAYKDYLFLPFKDLTNGDESYGGGRFIDLRIPAGDELILDFNQSYNPYCAYSDKYSCPIPPKENHLTLPILAGIKAPADHH